MANTLLMKIRVLMIAAALALALAVSTVFVADDAQAEAVMVCYYDEAGQLQYCDIYHEDIKDEP